MSKGDRADSVSSQVANVVSPGDRAGSISSQGALRGTTRSKMMVLTLLKNGKMERQITRCDTSIPVSKLYRNIFNFKSNTLGCFVSHSKETPQNWIKIDLDATLAELDTLGDFNSLKFEITKEQVPKVKNAFDLLHNTSDTTFWGIKAKVSSRKRDDMRLQNDLIDLIRENMGGETGFKFSESMAPTTKTKSVSQNFVDTLASSLYYLSSHWQRFKDRNIAIPDIFTLKGPYNTKIVGIKQMKNMTASELSRIANDISNLQNQKFLNRKEWKWLRHPLDKLEKSIRGYSLYLESRKTSQKLHNSRTEQKRDPMFFGDFRTIELDKTFDDSSQYVHLAAKLEKMDDLEPIFLNDFKADKTPDQWYQWKRKLTLPFRARLFSFDVGSSVGTLVWVYKITAHETDAFRTEEQTLIGRLRTQLPSFNTRAMQKSFLDEISFLSGFSVSVKRYLFEKLTGTKCGGLSQISREVLDRIRALSQIDDEEIVLDYRSANGRPGNTFDAFWDAVSKVIADKQAAEKRRHGTDSLLPHAMSVAHLSEQAQKLIPEGAAVPCNKTILLQFSPKDPFSHTALRHSFRFDMKFVMQSRDLRANNQDAYYVAVIKKYARLMLILIKEIVEKMCADKSDELVVVYTSSDDKHTINIGEPGLPLTPGTRQRRAIASANEEKHSAGDHDTNCKFTIQPSVLLQIDIPKSYEDGWYKGTTFFDNHDTIFNPSSQFRHLLLSLQHLRMTERIGKVVLLVNETDGGTDHQITTVQGQICDLLLLWMSGADAVYHIKSASGWSFTNVCERVMPIFNIALNCVALSRALMSEICENWLKNCSTMKEIREQSEKRPALRNAIAGSLKAVIEILDELFSQLHLKDEKFTPFGPTVSDLLEVGKLLQKLNPQLSVEGPWTRAHVRKNFPQVLEAISCHFLKERYYFNGLFKCVPGSESHCGICTDPVSSTEFLIELRSNLLLPDPEHDPKRSGKFLHYDDCKSNGLKTSEKYMPSFETRESKSIAGLSSQTARGFVKCLSCDKPRVYYSAKRLAREEIKCLQLAIDGIDFRCGSPLISETHPNDGVVALLNKVKLNTSLACWNHVEWAYYSKTVGSPFPRVCCWCAGGLSAENLKARAQKLEIVQTCLPLCSEKSCLEKGWQTRGKKRAKIVKSKKSSKKAKISSQNSKKKRNISKSSQKTNKKARE